MKNKTIDPIGFDEYVDTVNQIENIDRGNLFNE